MSVLVDSSALYALLDADDRNHGSARRFLQTEGSRTRFVTHQYVIVETIALVQRRIGIEAVRAIGRLLDIVDLRPVDRDLHDRALTALLGAQRQQISFVDWTSFTLMRDLGLRVAFTFDRDFVDQGFEVIPDWSEG